VAAVAPRPPRKLTTSVAPSMARKADSNAVHFDEIAIAASTIATTARAPAATARQGEPRGVSSATPPSAASAGSSAAEGTTGIDEEPNLRVAGR